jgi:anti-anti-sigma regulatory factor
MFHLSVEKIGDIAFVSCEGRIVRSEAAFQLRDAVTQHSDARIVVVDLSSVDALEAGGLGMLLFLQRWTQQQGIQFKVFGPPTRVRQRLERSCSIAPVEIAGMAEMWCLLSCRTEPVANSCSVA